jgi:aminopeptidase N
MVVLPGSFPFGGMENVQLTFLSKSLIAGDRSLATVVAHEIVHSWAGNLVTNKTWTDFWLNEGIKFSEESKNSYANSDFLPNKPKIIFTHI